MCIISHVIPFFFGTLETKLLSSSSCLPPKLPSIYSSSSSSVVSVWLIHTFGCERIVVVVAFFGGYDIWYDTLAEDEKRGYSAQTVYFRIYKDAVWQCHGINRELVFGEKTSAQFLVGRCHCFITYYLFSHWLSRARVSINIQTCVH